MGRIDEGKKGQSKKVDVKEVKSKSRKVMKGSA